MVGRFATFFSDGGSATVIDWLWLAACPPAGVAAGTIASEPMNGGGGVTPVAAAAA